MYINAEHQVTSTHSQSRNILNYYANERKKKQKRKKALQELFANSLSQLFWLLSIALRRKYTAKKQHKISTLTGDFPFLSEHKKRHVESLNGEHVLGKCFHSINERPKSGSFDPFDSLDEV